MPHSAWLRGWPASLAIFIVAAGCTSESRTGGIEGWTPRPTDPNPAFLDAAIKECLLTDGIGLAPELVDAPVLQDQRGPNAAAFLWLGADHEAECVLVRSGASFEVILAQAYAGLVRPDDPLGAVVTNERQPVMVHGLADPIAAATEVETESGLKVEATVGHRRFIAWWPGDDPPAVVRSLAVDGSVLREGIPD